MEAKLSNKGLRCPRCNSRKLRTPDSRPAPNGRHRRRKLCRVCNFSWRTYEIHEDRLPKTSSKEISFELTERQVKLIEELATGVLTHMKGT